MMQIAKTQALESDCDRAKVGCAFMDYKTGSLLIGTHNRAHAGNSKNVSCKTHGHLMVDGHCERTIHAEQAAIILAAKHAIDLEGSVLIITHTPCVMCTKLLVEIGIKAIYIKESYRPVHEAYEWLTNSKTKVFNWSFDKICW